MFQSFSELPNEKSIICIFYFAVDSPQKWKVVAQKLF